MTKTSSPSAEIRLRTRPAPVEIAVIGSDFRRIATGTGELGASVEPGIYEIRFRAGPRITSRMVHLGPGEAYVDDDVVVAFPSAAPLRGSSTDDSEHLALTARITGLAADVEAALVVVVREVMRGEGPPEITEDSLRELSLSSGLGPIHDFAEGWTVEPEAGWAGWRRSLAAGGYALEVRRHDRSRSRRDRFAQSLWLPKERQTVVFLPATGAGVLLEEASVHYLPADLPWSAIDGRTAEALELGRFGLREGRSVLPPDLLTLLLESKWENPMLGIVGAHALLLEREVDESRLATVLDNLERLLPGHPDVVALRRIAPYTGRNRQAEPSGRAIHWPPMLAASFAGVIAITPEDPSVVEPGSAAESAAGKLQSRGVWTAWDVAMTLEERLEEKAELEAKRQSAGAAEEGVGDALEEEPVDAFAYELRLVARESAKVLARWLRALLRLVLVPDGWWPWSTSFAGDVIGSVGGRAGRMVDGYVLQFVAANRVRKVSDVFSISPGQIVRATGLPASIAKRWMSAAKAEWLDRRARSIFWLSALLLLVAVSSAALIGADTAEGRLPGKVALGLAFGAAGGLLRLSAPVVRSLRRNELLDPLLLALALPLQGAVGAVTGLVAALLAHLGVIPVPGSAPRAAWSTLALYALVAGLLSPALAPPPVRAETYRKDMPMVSDQSDPGAASTADKTGTEPAAASIPDLSWNKPTVYAAVVALGLFVWFVVWMLGSRADKNWDRIVYVFGSAEAIAFAAAGALFGTKVQSQQTQQAQKQAATEKARAVAAEGQAQIHAVRAARGESLAAAVKAAAAAPEGGDVVRRGAGGGAGGGDVLAHLAAIAETVLPGTPPAGNPPVT